MMQQITVSTMSREEYLALEAHSEIKHEFFQGEIFARAGSTFNHARLSGNVTAALAVRLRGGRCEPMNSDMRVQTPTGLNTYPDASVFCGKPELQDGQCTLLNPLLIIEVLSPSTRSYDRGDKFAHYRSIPVLQDYLLIDSTRLAVEHFRRTSNGEWILHEYQALTDTLPLPAIGIELPLTEIYAGIDWEL